MNAKEKQRAAELENIHQQDIEKLLNADDLRLEQYREKQRQKRADNNPGGQPPLPRPSPRR